MRSQNTLSNLHNLIKFMEYANTNLGFKWKSRVDNDILLQERNIVANCTLCELSKTRHNSVFGDGTPDAEIMLIGEGPGETEDLTGHPFVGRSGKLLTKLLLSLGIKRESIYIANIIKCRPPGNRNPLPTEISNCSHYLYRQIEIIKPKLLFGLGKFAASFLFGSDLPIGKLRGKFIRKNGILTGCSYHPAYLLRNPSAAEIVKKDLKMAIEKINHE